MAAALSELSRTRISPALRAVERGIREEVQDEVGKLLDERRLLAPGADEEDLIRATIRNSIESYQRRAANTNAPDLPDPAAVEQRIFDALLRLGVLQPLMDDPDVEEIICNSPNRVFTIKNGNKMFMQNIQFDSEEEMISLVKRLIGPLGRRIDESSPMVDAQLPDGSRLNAAIPPITMHGVSITIRKFVLRTHSIEGLVELGTLTPTAAEFLDAAVQAGVNILVSGPTGSGKTTMLNALGTAIPSLDERVITVEEVAELQLAQRLPDCVALQSRASNVEGVGEISIRNLVRNALRMRPTRIVVGEVRDKESLDMLMAMNTGHEGSLTTIHGNSPSDALYRLVTLASMSEERLPTEALTRMVSHTIDLVLQLRPDPRTGRRIVTHIFETSHSLEMGSAMSGNDLWVYNGDKLVWTGIRPRCLEKIEAKGIQYTLPAGREF